LVPALVLARVDGKSTVEYLKDQVQTRVRNTALRLLEQPPATFRELVVDWRQAFFP